MRPGPWGSKGGSEPGMRQFPEGWDVWFGTLVLPRSDAVRPWAVSNMCSCPSPSMLATKNSGSDVATGVV